MEFKLSDNIFWLVDVEDEAVLIGCLNKNFGYNYFDPIPKGTPVYELKDKYFFEMRLTRDGSIIPQRFYKETLAPAIDFLTSPTQPKEG